MFHFYGVFKECKKSVLSHQFQLAAQEWMCRPPLNGFGNVKEVLAFLNKRFNRTCLGEVRRQNEILKELISIHKEPTVSVDLYSLFLVIFQPALQKLFRSYLWVDPTGKDLGQVIFSAFLEAINNYALSKYPEKIALNIVLNTKRQVVKWISEENQTSQAEVSEEENPVVSEGEVNRSPEKALVTLIDLANGFGYDEADDQICLRINSLHKKGIISDEEKRIITARLVYQETLHDLVTVHEEFSKREGIGSSGIKNAFTALYINSNAE